MKTAIISSQIKFNVSSLKTSQSIQLVAGKEVLEVKGKQNIDAARHYPEIKSAAEGLKNYVAFRRKARLKRK